jgi:hemin uptake protein HemP
VTDGPDRPADADVRAKARLSSTDLFRGQRELVIVHGGQEYLLRITKSDKLILTK